MNIGICLKSLKFFFLVATCLALSPTGKLTAHCEIPCGIYDDQLRLQLMREHVMTIEKG